MNYGRCTKCSQAYGSPKRISDEQELGCKDCVNYNEFQDCEIRGGGIEVVTPDNIMCVHHPEYIKHMNAISPMINIQLATFKTGCNEICEDEDDGNCDCESCNRTAQLKVSGYL